MSSRQKTFAFVTLVSTLLLLPACSEDSSEPARALEPAAPPATTEDTTEAEPVAAPEIAWRTAPSADGRYFIRWRPLVEPIPMADPFDVEVELYADEAMAEPPGYETILVDAGMPHHGHGMNVQPEIKQRADGSWIARGMLMHMPGRWQVYVDVLDDGRLERAQWSMWLSG